jgi:hypothetical protein
MGGSLNALLTRCSGLAGGEALRTAGGSRELFIPGADANDKHQKTTLLTNGNVLFFAVPLLRLDDQSSLKVL